MLKPKIALVDSDFESLSNYHLSFKEKYEVFEFSSTDSYLTFIQSEKSNPFNLLIIDLKSNGAKSALNTIEFCKENNLHCAYMMTCAEVTKAELIKIHNLGAYKIFEKPVDTADLNLNIQNFLYDEHIKFLNREMEISAFKIAQHTDIFISVLNEFVSNKDLNEFYMNRYPNEEIQLDFKSQIKSLNEHFFANIKIREILLRQNSINENRFENLLV